MKRKTKEPPPHMLTEGNTHLGRDIWTFSLPAVSTCPGLSLVCLLVCYAMRPRFACGPGLRLHKANWARAQEPKLFVRQMDLEIKFRRVRLLRIHVAGDFYSPEYVRSWMQVAKKNPSTTFFFYTRSWRAPAIREPLVEFASMANVYAWWSEDAESGPSRMPVGRRCFLAADRGDEVLAPEDIDLIFRDKTRDPLKWVGPAWVCAKEQGVPHGLTCSACRRCFVPGPMPRRPLAETVWMGR